MEIHLVADTNLFFECRVLEELPWEELGFDPVVILLTKPVLDEIDKHKKTSGRTKKRALDIFSHVRGMLTGSQSEIEIKPSSPRVLLRRAPANLTPADVHKGYLDYGKTDERLVGMTAALSAQAAGYCVKLFTDDTGPATTADGLGIPYLMISESWRRQQQETNEAIRVKELEKEVASLRASEPKIVIDCIQPTLENGKIALVQSIATPLTNAEIDELIERLRSKFPLVTDFKAPKPSSVTDTLGNVTTTEFEVSTDLEIAEYTDVLYPKWIEKCSKILSDLHVGRNQAKPIISASWSIKNSGNRPATKARIVFEAKGQVTLIRYRADIEEDEDDLAYSEGAATSPHGFTGLSRFPEAPKPPAFQKTISRLQVPKADGSADTSIAGVPAILTAANSVRLLEDAKRAVGASGLLNRLSALQGTGAFESASRLTGIQSLFRDPSYRSIIDNITKPSSFAHQLPYVPILPRSLVNPSYDQEGFYYDEWPLDKAVTRGALTCDLWRHQAQEEIFDVEVQFTVDGPANGVVTCTVHAENLTTPVQHKLVVSLSLAPTSIFGDASSMVDQA